ncbi:MAG: hypothetical protein Q8P92_02940 [Candidatus Daviesbacteria bacterium]|nr:hypothetical protein [Candidatus Daviesbacteria bacterium]
MPKQNQKGSPRFSEAGIAPLVIILILAVTIVGGFGVYKSSKKINIREDKTTETTGGNLYPKTPSPNTVNLANSGNLANESVEIKADETSSESPKFSITPPAGWEKLPANSNIVLEFLSPAKDTIEEGLVYFDVQPNITVFVAKGDYESLDEAYAAYSSKANTDVSKQKTTINGQEAIITRSTKDLADLLRGTLESQIKQEIAKSGTKISEQELKKDVETLLENAKAGILSYSFYKDGYYINVAGKALESFWDKREPQLKRSMDTFKFE